MKYKVRIVEEAEKLPNQTEWKVTAMYVSDTKPILYEDKEEVLNGNQTD